VSGIILTVADEHIGEFDRPHVDELRGRPDVRPHATTAQHLELPVCPPDWRRILPWKIRVKVKEPVSRNRYRRSICGGRER
jgi:hypothetical protein